MNQITAYARAQQAIAELKVAVYEVLMNAPEEGLTNAQIGRTLGIYMGHVRHQGHVPRTLLALMEAESVVVQDPNTKRWRVRRHTEQIEADDAD